MLFGQGLVSGESKRRASVKAGRVGAGLTRPRNTTGLTAAKHGDCPQGKAMAATGMMCRPSPPREGGLLLKLTLLTVLLSDTIPRARQVRCSTPMCTQGSVGRVSSTRAAKPKKSRGSSNENQRRERIGREWRKRPPDWLDGSPECLFRNKNMADGSERTNQRVAGIETRI